MGMEKDRGDAPEEGPKQDASPPPLPEPNLKARGASLADSASGPPPPPPPAIVHEEAEEGGRRGFLKAAACCALGGIAVGGPVAAGTLVFIDPLFDSEGQGGAMVPVTSLDALKIGEEPKLFHIIAERKDAWTRHEKTPIGSVFIERQSEETLVVFSSICPHLGCAVEFRGNTDAFYCPCHNSTFARDGEINDPGSPSARGLDTLEWEVREEGEVWVKFERFQTGKKEKIAIT